MNMSDRVRRFKIWDLCCCQTAVGAQPLSADPFDLYTLQKIHQQQPFSVAASARIASLLFSFISNSEFKTLHLIFRPKLGNKKSNFCLLILYQSCVESRIYIYIVFSSIMTHNCTLSLAEPPGLKESLFPLKITSFIAVSEFESDLLASPVWSTPGKQNKRSPQSFSQD